MLNVIRHECANHSELLEAGLSETQQAQNSDVEFNGASIRYHNSDLNDIIWYPYLTFEDQGHARDEEFNRKTNREM